MRKEDSLSLQLSRYLQLQYPKVIYHFDLASGGMMSIGMAMRNKRMNPVSGYPDLFIAHPKRNAIGQIISCGLFLELKSENVKLFLKDGKTMVSNPHLKEQAEMLNRLSALGYSAFFGIGFSQCQKLIDEYLK